MATISFKEFSQGQPVSVVANEGKALREEAESGSPSLMSKLAERAKTFGSELSLKPSRDILNNAQPGENKDMVATESLLRGAQSPIRAIGAVGGAIGDVVGAGLESTGLDKPIAEALQPVVESDPVQKAMSAFKMLPQDTQDVLGAIVNTANIPLAGGAKSLVTSATKKVISPKTIDGIPVSTLADDVLHSGLQLKNDIQLSIAKKNVSPQLESSASRLIKDTTGTVENPSIAYEKYLAQSKKSLTDIKADAPISEVGSKIGDAFMKVVKQRQQVGATLGDELKNVGKLRVSVTEPKATLLSELKDSGLSYNPKTNSLTSFQGSKFAPEEVAMLDDFTKGLQKLGETPTVSQIDNFISKTRSDLNFAKGKSGVIGTTNAERIIKGALNGMRESLNPSKNGLTQLSTYWRANETYSKLSDFVEEGSTFLGKKTQSGDFAKDASIAKSSVQSILNGGKKDWLIQLEALTGYKALDESVLALQAMKDAGDFKGLSLLQAMQESGGIPTSKAGFTQRILDLAVQKGGKLIVGTPEEQTRALLQDLSKNSSSASTPMIKSIPNPNGGTKTQSIKSSNSSDIQPNTTPSTTKSKGIRGMVNPSELNPFKKEATKYKTAEEFATSDKHIIDRSGELVKVGDKVTFARGGSEFNGKLVKVKSFDGSYDTTSVKGKEFKDYSPEVVVEATEDVYNKGGFPIHKKGDKFNVDMYQINEYKDGYKPIKTKSELTKIWNDANELVPKKKVVSEPVTQVFHGTSLENATKINNEGFLVGKGKGVSGTPSDSFIYVTESKDSANKYVADKLGIKNPTTVGGSFSGKILDIQGKMADFEAFGEASKKLGVPLGKDSQGKLSMLDMTALKKAMQEQGYSAIRFSDRYQNGTKALAVIPEKLSKTPSKVPTLEQEAKK